MTKERLGLFFYPPSLQLKILTHMVYKETSLTVDIFQNNLGDDPQGIIIMIATNHLSSDKKFLKLPS